MLTKIELRAPGGTTPLTLDVVPSATTRYRITSVNGLGPVKADITSATRNQNDGNIFQNRRVGPRNIVITMEVLPDYQNNKSVQELRRDIYRVAGQNKSVEVTLFNTEIGELKIKGYVEDIIPNIFTKDTLLQMSIICPSPYYEGSEVTEVFSGNSPTQATLSYAGDVPAPYVMLVKSTFNNRQSVFTHDQLDWDPDNLDNLNRWEIPSADQIPAGATVEISSIPGDRKIRVLPNRNLLKYMFGTASSIDYHWFEMAPGRNRIRFTSSSAHFEVTVKYKPLYEGI